MTTTSDTIDGIATGVASIREGAKSAYVGPATQ
jgi:hypothetical protein